ncbi:MAG: glycosyltransferase [Lewinellaceae bacterium]|nr:glycosyltransferase [Lewinellaceae bacterium]
MKKLFLRWLVKPFAGTLVFHTASDQEATDIKTLFPQARCTVIANGVEVEEHPVETSFADPGIYIEKFTGIGAHTNPGLIVSLCRLHKVKGLDILIRAVHQLIQKKLPVVLIIAGPDFGELETLQQLVADLNLQENVFFPGELAGEEKWRFLRGADVFALPSYHENFGIAYLEALAVGVPIVASQHTPWQEVEEAGCGLWVANTPDAFSKAIESLLATGKQAISGRARSYARRFSWDSIAQQFITAYRNSNHIT